MLRGDRQRPRPTQFLYYLISSSTLVLLPRLRANLVCLVQRRKHSTQIQAFNVSLHAEVDYPSRISVFTTDYGSFSPVDFARAMSDKGVGEGVNTISRGVRIAIIALLF
jgi:hypothetical protein